MGASGWTHVEVTVVACSEKAILARLKDGREIWVPNSTLDDSKRYWRGDTKITMSVMDWFAEKNNIQE